MVGRGGAGAGGRRGRRGRFGRGRRGRFGRGRGSRREIAAAAAIVAAALAVTAYAVAAPGAGDGGAGAAPGAGDGGAGAAPGAGDGGAGAAPGAGRFPVRAESGFDGGLVEMHVYEMTNAERAGRGLGELERIAAIDALARGHSRDMAARGYFSHDTPEGLDPAGRARAAGLDCRRDVGSHYAGPGENLHQAHTYSSYMVKGLTLSYAWLGGEEELARGLVDGWMGSPGHRGNILDPRYVGIGIGVAITGSEEVLATQNFC